MSPDVSALAVMRFHVPTGNRKGDASRGATREMGVMEAHMVRKALDLGVRVGIRGMGGNVDRAICSSCSKGADNWKELR